MPFYRLNYNGAQGSALLPVDINQNASQAALDAFAKTCGDDHFDWDCLAIEEAIDIDAPLEQIDWAPLKQAFIDEPSLFEYPWSVFERRIRSGYMAAVIDADNKAVVTVNIIPKMTEHLRSVLGVPQDQNPQVFETGAGWADKAFRGRGVYTQLRQELITGSDAQGRLIFSQGKGKGAANVNIKNGWTLVDWSEFPFASALMGWKQPEPPANSFCLAAGLVIDIPDQGLYEGDTVLATSPMKQQWLKQRDWSHQHHLWVNDIGKLRRFEENLKDGLQLRPDSPKDAVDQALHFWKRKVAESLFHDRGLLGDTPEIQSTWQEFEDHQPPGSALRPGAGQVNTGLLSVAMPSDP